MPSSRTGTPLRLSLLLASFLPFACSPEGGTSPGTGGAAAGGSVAVGGSTSGGVSSGGSGAAGGSPAAGGALMVGGSPSAGGSAAGGSGGSTAGAGGGGGSGVGGSPDGSGGSASASVSQAGDIVSFAWKDKVLSIDAAHGARVTSLKMGEKELISQKNSDSYTNYGSTFWTSPQTEWNWPPVDAIDTEAYSVTMPPPAPNSGEVIFESGPATVGTATFVITKIVSVDVGLDVITIRYGIKNTGAAAASVAGWEITRHEPGGLSFFPTGTAKAKDELSGVTEMNGVSWFQHTPSTPEGKLNADGAEGWEAHVGDGFLLITAFADVPANGAAPGEGDVELYASADASYIEVENQGPYVNLAAGMSTEHKVRWLARGIDGLTVSAGSTQLVDKVRSELQAAETSAPN